MTWGRANQEEGSLGPASRLPVTFIHRTKLYRLPALSLGAAPANKTHRACILGGEAMYVQLELELELELRASYLDPHPLEEGEPDLPV